ncbi:tRNA (N6-threonylcarbamoyladenosine(37)-N6)-methyltransferase TrmO [Azorhizobium oxalatiphilum]|uniref:tRNA (N6-threonylcarbamoyladenosine(37)-N6)-methyltransferase TrmO n=1 Tax=Azorhizobium oxalatiphilum TaxID=980631 RepID=A0A917CF10_9HYPH|nr:SAM-dependent methyltransferase [Azorhizobium oxalatiphilum]GGF83394.1 tRNA (N6-threonylcarbamoyladenosine(37)-N6)-methyltransferase TrmO [Azorhizobium oxalatiphilum]
MSASESSLSPSSPPAWDQLRPGERAVDVPSAYDAGLFFVGRIRTPFPDRSACPKRATPEGPECTLELDPRWAEALTGVVPGSWMQVLYWMDQARRDIVLQSPRHDGTVTGTFSLRSPVRPNPIASTVVKVLAVDGLKVKVRSLDCVDGTPLVDLKPDYCPHDDGPAVT